MVQHSFTSTETRRLERTDSPGRPPRLAHSSWTMPPRLTTLKFMLIVLTTEIRRHRPLRLACRRWLTHSCHECLKYLKASTIYKLQGPVLADATMMDCCNNNNSNIDISNRTFIIWIMGDICLALLFTKGPDQCSKDVIYTQLKRNNNNNDDNNSSSVTVTIRIMGNLYKGNLSVFEKHRINTTRPETTTMWLWAGLA